MADQTAEYVDRGALGAHRLVADDPRAVLEIPPPPYGDALIPLDHRLGQPVQAGVRAGLVELNKVYPAFGDQCVEGSAEPAAGPRNRAPPRGFEAGAVT